MAFYQSNRYFSIFGLHYLVGYGGGAPALEAWAVAHPLRVISQVYVDSPGLGAGYLNSYGPLEFDGDTDANYTTVVFPEGFDRIRYDEAVLPTWYINPDRRSIDPSLSYWTRANDTDNDSRNDGMLGRVFKQRRRSGRWMTSHAGPISQVAVRDRPTQILSRSTTSQIVDFLTYYTRYENFFAYGNQLYERADYARLGIEVRTMMVEGFVREYLVHVPRSAQRIWRGEAPVLYPVDPARFYSTGQSAGSQVTQNFAIAFPEYFAAVASTSFTAAPNSSGTVNMDGVAHPASNRMIPNYHIYGYGDLPFLAGGLWDATQNSLDSWAAYHLQVDGLELSDVDNIDGVRSGWHDRLQTWTWRDPATAKCERKRGPLLQRVRLPAPLGQAEALSRGVP